MGWWQLEDQCFSTHVLVREGKVLLCDSGKDLGLSLHPWAKELTQRKNSGPFTSNPEESSSCVTFLSFSATHKAAKSLQPSDSLSLQRSKNLSLHMPDISFVLQWSTLIFSTFWGYPCNYAHSHLPPIWLHFKQPKSKRTAMTDLDMFSEAHFQMFNSSLGVKLDKGIYFCRF